MSLLISRFIFTAIIIGAAYFALVKVWTQKVDILSLLKKPSESIPLVKEAQQVEEKVTINPTEYVAHPLYHEFTAHITNQNNFPIYDYAVVIMVSRGELNVNKDLKFEPLETLEQTKSEIPVKAFGLGGISDKYGLSYMELHFPEMAANSSKKYLVKINGDKYKDASTLQFKVGRFSKQPNPTFRMPLKLDKNGKLPQKIILPDSMKNK